MIYDLQKASMWKRISAFLFDLIMLSIVSVLFAWALSVLVGYDGYQRKLDDTYARYGERYGVDMRLPLAEYEALDEDGRNALDEAYAALSSDSTAVGVYNMITQLTILIISLGLLAGYLAMEFALPLKFGNGVTLGKKIFGLAVMRSDGVKLNTVSLFIRTVLGKFAIETMIPVIILMMIFWGTIGIVGPIVLFAILAVEIIVMVSTRTNAMIHDLLANTVVVDYASQMIFDTYEDMIHYKEKLHAEMAARQEY
ncbi:MAG: RDD family protein [Clostridia bacterium]|nr:RDD family protein [Clostridia bacterium]